MAIRHEYKIVWLNPRPVIKEELSYEQGIENAHNTHAVAVRNLIDWDINLLDMFNAKYLHYEALVTFD